MGKLVASTIVVLGLLVGCYHVYYAKKFNHGLSAYHCGTFQGTQVKIPKTEAQVAPGYAAHGLFTPPSVDTSDCNAQIKELRLRIYSDGEIVQATNHSDDYKNEILVSLSDRSDRLQWRDDQSKTTINEIRKSGLEKTQTDLPGYERYINENSGGSYYLRFENGALTSQINCDPHDFEFTKNMCSYSYNKKSTWVMILASVDYLKKLNKLTEVSTVTLAKIGVEIDLESPN